MGDAEPNGVPALKDPDVAHPIPDAWRPVLCDVVRALSNGDYELASTVPGVAPVAADVAEQVRAYVADYGATLVELPSETWQTSVAGKPLLTKHAVYVP